MAIRYRRYRANNFRFTRQASVRELELTAAIVFIALLTYFSTRVSTATLWVIFICIVILGIIIGIVSFTVFQRSLRRHARAIQVLGVIDIDQMEPLQFESYIENLLEARGLHVLQILQQNNDSTLFITQKGKKLIGVRLFRRAHLINATMLRDTILTKADYGLNALTVITTSSFTPSARRIAFANRTELIDRRHLAYWVLAFQEQQHTI